MIELIDVTKYYGLKEVGLKDVSLTFKKGEITGVLGQNGSGKSTLLKAVMGLGELNKGKILIDGKSVRDQYERMAFITEEGSFFPFMTPDEYGDFLSMFFNAFNHERYQSLLKFFDIDAKEKMKGFSKGQKAKIETAAGFSKGADIILMDEPFLGKDIVTRRDFLKLMNASLRADETILVATHLLDEMENLLDRVVVLRYGRVLADFYMDEIREQGISLSEEYLSLGGFETDRYQQLAKEM